MLRDEALGNDCAKMIARQLRAVIIFHLASMKYQLFIIFLLWIHATVSRLKNFYI
ncbi:hypothetical protein ACJX0J_009607, partial [Zea mays]